eukprot:8220858-Karenia_brevis.AAC.1
MAKPNQEKIGEAPKDAAADADMEQADEKPTQPYAANEIPPVTETNKNPEEVEKQALVVDSKTEEISKLEETPMIRVSPPRKVNLLE